ncbi:MAG TPA: ATP-binding cassette domain-containing protein, partial [Acidimicrobiales bacterium]|nr:ATP-binding cassette domain-containing protein [Acidimicrobiales bacterium]
MAAVAEADGLTKRWGDTVALADVTFSIGRGVTGLLGANGAGKTTLMSLLLGLHRPDAGRVRILGEDPSVAGVRARIGWSPDAEALPPDAPA